MCSVYLSMISLLIFIALGLEFLVYQGAEWFDFFGLEGVMSLH
jgi:hypothetical protein